jgi:hypothetical protein
LGDKKGFEFICATPMNDTLELLRERAASVTTRDDLAAFLDGWLCGPHGEDCCEGAPVSPLLNAVAWCLGKLDERGVARNELPSWRLFGQILFAAVYYGTAEYDQWLGCRSDSSDI